MITFDKCDFLLFLSMNLASLKPDSGAVYWNSLTTWLLTARGGVSDDLDKNDDLMTPNRVIMTNGFASSNLKMKFYDGSMMMTMTPHVILNTK